MDGNGHTGGWPQQNSTYTRKDLTLLQEESMGLGDSMRQRYKIEKGVEATEDEFVRWLMEDCQKPRQKKLQ